MHHIYVRARWLRRSVPLDRGWALFIEVPIGSVWSLKTGFSIRRVVTFWKSPTYCRFVLVQYLIILAHRYTENNCRHVLETVDPLLPFRPLTAHVEQSETNDQSIRYWRTSSSDSAITHLKLRFLNEKCTSTIPVVLTLVRRMSCSVGWYSLAPNRSKSSKKLKREGRLVECGATNLDWYSLFGGIVQLVFVGTTETF